MHRRSFLKSLARHRSWARASPPRGSCAAKAKSPGSGFYQPPNPNQTFNQSNMVGQVETDIGITGVGEGRRQGTCWNNRRIADRKGPRFGIELLAGDVHGWFYPPGREKIDAIGALDLALWTSRARH